MNKIENLAKSYIYWPEIANPFQTNISFGENSFVDFSKTLKLTLNQTKIDVPTHILEFYALNQYLYENREKQGNVLDDKLIGFYKDYQNTINALSKKMFCYIFITSMVEARQSHDFNEQNSGLNTFLEKNSNTYDGKIEILKKEYQAKIVETYKDDCPEGFYETFKLAHQILNKSSLENPENDDIYTGKSINSLIKEFSKIHITLDDMMKTFIIIFKKNNFFEGNFGGKPWEEITEHALKFSQGKINAEVFVDQAFSLEHNGGTIFNKDVIFNLVPHFSIKLGNSFMNNIQIKMSNFLLNMQHQGEILNFLNFGSFFENTNKKAQLLELKPEERKSIDLFNSQMKKLSDFFIKSPSLKKIALSVRNEKFSNGVDWLSSLSYKSQDNKNQKFLNDYQKKILELANFAQKEKINENNITNNLNYFYLGKVPDSFNDKSLIGAKAHGLNSLLNIGQNVPQGIVFPCSGPFNDSNELKLEETIKEIQENLSANCLYSVRSGARVSMPGMMDTVLNVGIDDSNYEFHVNKMGQKVVDECAMKFMKMFSKSYVESKPKENIKDIKNINWPKTLNGCLKKFKNILKENFIEFNEDRKFPLTSTEQMSLSFKSVLGSFYSPRAISFRNHNSISDNLGTALIIQEMVFGNLNTKSCTGVMFSRDCITGKPTPIGEFLTQGQGEDVVSGEVTPSNLSEMKKWDKNCYNELMTISKQLEKTYGAIQDIEFTIEDKKVFILQTRGAVVSDLAQTILLKEKYDKQEITFDNFLQASNEKTFVNHKFVQTNELANYKGLCANPGVISGIVINTSDKESVWQGYLDNNKNNNFENLILVSEKTSPEHFPVMMKCQGFITQEGGFTSHAAIIARSCDKPCVVGAVGVLSLKTGDRVTIDAKAASIWLGVPKIVSSNNSSFIKKMIDENNIDIQAISKNSLIEELNNNHYWMNFGSKTHIKNNIHNPHPFNSFLKMGQSALAKMSYASKKLNTFNMN